MPAELKVDAALTLYLAVMDQFHARIRCPSDQRRHLRLTPPVRYLLESGHLELKKESSP